MKLHYFGMLWRNRMLDVSTNEFYSVYRAILEELLYEKTSVENPQAILLGGTTRIRQNHNCSKYSKE